MHLKEKGCIAETINTWLHMYHQLSVEQTKQTFLQLSQANHWHHIREDTGREEISENGTYKSMFSKVLESLIKGR